jgi:hypothetical protein
MQWHAMPSITSKDVRARCSALKPRCGKAATDTNTPQKSSKGVPIIDMFSYFQQLCGLKSGSRPLCFDSIVISQRFHSISIFFCPSLNARLFFSFVTSFPGAQSRNYIWATNTPDDTELYGSSLRYPVEQTGAPYNLA